MISIANIHDETPLNDEALAKLREIFEGSEDDSK